MRQIKRVTSTIDMRLPYHIFMQRTIEQDQEMPLEIVEGSTTYQAVDGKVESAGDMLSFVTTYEEVTPHA